MANKHQPYDLKQMQSIPLEGKIIMTQERIRQWYDHWDGQVYVSFSGGKDSTVLLHLARQLYPDIEAVFVNTGLEYPEIQQFVRSHDNVTILRPKMRFDEVIKTYGYPIISKAVADTVSDARKNLEQRKYSLRLRSLGMTAEEARALNLQMPSEEMLARYEKAMNGSKHAKPKYRPLLNTDFIASPMCCVVMKKQPAHDFQNKTGKKPILATMAEESMLREAAWLKNGCNAFNAKRPTSQPMSFWTNQDVLWYIKKYNIDICSVYGDIVYEVESDQIRYDDILGINWVEGELDKLCTTGCDRTGCIFCAFGCHLDKGESRFERLIKTHPRQYEYCINGGEHDENGIWKPNKQGFGMGHVFDELNKIYGEGFIRY